MVIKHKYRIIVPANTTDFNQKILDAVAPVIPPDVKLDVKNITGGIPEIQCRANLATNAPYVMDLAVATEKEGFDGIFVTDFDMAGVEPSRELISIPILGGFQASAYTAMMIAQQFSIITIMESVLSMQREHVRQYQITGNFASIRPIDVPVHQLGNLDVVVPKVFNESMKAILEDGAEAIILGCTGFIGVAERVGILLKEAGYPAPVVDTNLSGICYLDLLVRNRLSQSRLTYSKESLKGQPMQ